MTPQLKQSWDKLEAQRSATLAKLKSESDAVLNKQPEAGKWSVMQVLLHQIAIEQNTKRYFEKKLPEAATIENAGFKNSYFYFILKTALLLPKKYKAPTHTEPSDESISLVEIEKKWIDIRKELEATVGNLSDEILNKQLFKHPSGKLSIYQAMNFLRIHFSRHENQIERTLEEAKK